MEIQKYFRYEICENILFGEWTSAYSTYTYLHTYMLGVNSINGANNIFSYTFYFNLFIIVKRRLNGTGTSSLYYLQPM